MNINGKTTVTGIFGYPVGHSLSPAMHNAAFLHLNMNFCYTPFSVKPEFLGDAVKAIRALNLRGVNVTVPHKEKVIPLLDKIDEEAAFIGAVNTILNSDGRLTGYNTDGRGFMESLAEADIQTDNKTILIIGAGGASRAISYYLAKKAARLFIYDLDANKVEQLTGDLGRIYTNVIHIKSLDSLSDIDILINATPLGLKETDPSPVDVSLLTERTAVCDLIYKKTPLLAAASGKGCRTINGSGMLLHQGALAFEIWTGVKPPVAVMRKALMDAAYS